MKTPLIALIFLVVPLFILMVPTFWLLPYLNEGDSAAGFILTVAFSVALYGLFPVFVVIGFLDGREHEIGGLRVGVLLSLAVMAITLHKGHALYALSESPPNSRVYKQRSGNVANDGRRSSAIGSGAASHHGGVRSWLYKERTHYFTANEKVEWRNRHAEKAKKWWAGSYYLAVASLVFGWALVLSSRKTKKENKTQHHKSDRAGGSEA